MDLLKLRLILLNLHHHIFSTSQWDQFMVCVVCTLMVQEQQDLNPWLLLNILESLQKIDSAFFKFDEGVGNYVAGSPGESLHTDIDAIYRPSKEVIILKHQTVQLSRQYLALLLVLQITLLGRMVEIYQSPTQTLTLDQMHWDLLVLQIKHLRKILSVELHISFHQEM